MPKEKALEEKLEEASSAVERALEARDKSISGGKLTAAPAVMPAYLRSAF